MAVPTVTSLTPATGSAGGLNVIQIVGTNFQELAAQPATGPSVALPPTVEVLFGIELATFVDVISDTQLLVGVPPFKAAPTDDVLPPVDFTVRNIDSNGDLIGSEEIILEDAYTYKRPRIHGSPDTDDPINAAFTLVSASLIMAFRRQVIENVTQTTHVDYAEPGVLSIVVSKVPAVVLQGPTITNDLERTHDEKQEIDNGDGTVSILQPPLIKKAAYTIMGISNNEEEFMNMASSVEEMFRLGKFLGVDLDPENPDPATRVNLVLHLTQPPQITSTPSDDNIRTFAAVCEVRGIQITGSEPIDRTTFVTAPELQVQQIDGIAVEIIPV